MLTKLLQKYTHKSRIYLSWDAASWHLSKMLYSHVAEHNEAITNGEAAGPLVALVPLPAGAQFLNVIESVFSVSVELRLPCGFHRRGKASRSGHVAQ